MLGPVGTLDEAIATFTPTSEGHCTRMDLCDALGDRIRFFGAPSGATEFF